MLSGGQHKLNTKYDCNKGNKHICAYFNLGLLTGKTNMSALAVYMEKQNLFDIFTIIFLLFWVLKHTFSNNQCEDLKSYKRTSNKNKNFKPINS